MIVVIVAIVLIFAFFFQSISLFHFLFHLFLPFGSTPRKQVRNRQASCVSRLKKKIQQVQMEMQVEAQHQELADLQRLVKERDAVLARHGLFHLVTPYVTRPRGPATAAAARTSTPIVVAIPEQEDVVPSQSAAMPKRPRGRPRKHPRPEDRPAPEDGPVATTTTTTTTTLADLILPEKGLFPAVGFSTAAAYSTSGSLMTSTTLAATSSAGSSSLQRASTALLRQVSVPNPVCLCSGERDSSMVRLFVVIVSELLDVRLLFASMHTSSPHSSPRSPARAAVASSTWAVSAWLRAWRALCARGVRTERLLKCLLLFHNIAFPGRARVGASFCCSFSCCVPVMCWWISNL